MQTWLPSQLADYGLAGAVIAAQFGWIGLLLRNNKMLAKKVIDMADASLAAQALEADRLERLVGKIGESHEKLNDTMLGIHIALAGIKTVLRQNGSKDIT